MRPRLQREHRTLETMVRLYCRHQHGTGILCDDCRTLLAYAHTRLDACRFGAGKPACSRCPVHCYRPTERNRIRAVMRYAGPRMPLHHPWLTLLHIWDSLFERTTQQ